MNSPDMPVRRHPIDSEVLPALAAPIAAVKACRQPKVVVRSIDSSRDYIEIMEAVDAYFRVMQFGNAGEIYNVGSGKPTPVKSLLEELLVESGLSLDDVEVTHAGDSREEVVSFAEISKLSALPRLSA